MADDFSRQHFDRLSDEQKDAALERMLECIAARNSKLLDPESDNNLIAEIARSGAPNAANIFLRHVQKRNGPELADALRKCFAQRPRTTVDTLIHAAYECGANLEPWALEAPQDDTLEPQPSGGAPPEPNHDQGARREVESADSKDAPQIVSPSASEADMKPPPGASHNEGAPAPADEPLPQRHAHFLQLARRYIIPATNKTGGLRLCFDGEADGLLDVATKIHCIVIVDLDSDQIDTYRPGQIDDALKRLSQASYLTGHNIVGYDLPLLRRLHGWVPSQGCTVVDTLIASRLVLAHLRSLDRQAQAMGDPSLGKIAGSHSLKAWGARLGMPKVGTDIEVWAEYTPEMEARCIGDGQLTKTLWQFLQPDGQATEALTLEHCVVPVCDEITATGIPFDSEAGEQQSAQWTERRNALEARLREQFPQIENWNSRTQIAALLESRGWMPERRTKKTGQAKIDDETLESIMALYPEFDGLLEHFLLSRRLGQLATGDEAWLKHIGPDGRIHGGIIHIGTPHSRAAHMRPNIAQVPNPKRGKPFATECRDLFRARDNWVFVSSDQAGLQDRAFAHLLAAFDGGTYARAFVAGLDPHWATVQALGLVPAGTVRDKTNRLHTVLREGCKSWRYGFLFGMGDERAGSILYGIIKAALQIDPTCDLMRRFFGANSPSEAALKHVGAQALRKFIAATPGLGRLRERLEAQAQSGWLPGLDGRRVPVPAQYKALNYAVTSAEAVICKRWLVNVHDELRAHFRYGWDGDVVIVAWIHDELVACCRPEIADQVGEIMVRYAKEAGEHYKLRLPLEANYNTGRSWAGETSTNSNLLPSNDAGDAESPPDAPTVSEITSPTPPQAHEILTKLNNGGHSPPGPDRNQVKTFVQALFKHAAAGNWVSQRAFFEGRADLPPFKIVPHKLNGNLDILIDQAYQIAELAAHDSEKVVFCPPIATFTNSKHAREQDLAEGLTLSVECDARAQAARGGLEALLGPATVEVESGGEWTDPETGKTGPKLHLHYRLKTPARSKDEQRKLKLARKLVAKIVGSDPSNVPLVHPIRWPGSVHRKSDPKLCRIVVCNPDIEIDLDAALEILQEAAKSSGMAEHLALKDSDLDKGIEDPKFPPLPFEPIKQECAWLRHVHDTGGADQSEPLWRDALRCCIFLAEGRSLIHELGNRYSDYDFESTEAKYERARQDKVTNNLGFPRCQTIHDHGSTHCETCPHLFKDKSPLHLALQASPAGDFKPADEYDRVDRDAPELNHDLVKIDAVWMTRIFEGDTDGTYQDESQLAFAVACELVRNGLANDFIARVLMTTKCGGYVQERPAYRLLRTIRRAHEFVIDPDLEAMNSQHAVLPIGGKTRVVTWGDDPDFPGRKTIVRAQTFEDFKNLHSNRRKSIEIGTGDKKETKEIPFGHWWLSQRHRRQYGGGQRFMPRHEAEEVGNVLNMFEGFPIQPRKPDGRSGASGCQLFLDHGFKIICGGNEEHWDYLRKREAWIAQNRRRCEIAAAYRTEEEGSGKGFWCNHLGRLYGSYYMQVKRPEHVIGKHNRHLETLLKLCADEAVFVGDPRHRNVLFSLITEPTVDVEPKFIDAYSAPNHLNLDIISNATHFVPVSRTARRFFIPTVSVIRVGDFGYFDAIAKQLHDGGYEALLYHLLYEVDLRDFEVLRVPKTAGLAEQAEYSRKGVDGLVEKACSEGYVPCAHFTWPGFSVSTGQEDRQGFDHFIENHADRELRYLGALRTKRQLCKEWGCMSGNSTRRRDGDDRINGVQWPPLQQLRALFEQRHGPQDWLNPDIVEWPVQSTGNFMVARTA
jgi:DNA polymerase I-like protein with 3'-5' exonuclease and polymerase domains